MSLSESFGSFQDIDFADISSWPYALKLVVSLLIGILILVAIYILLYLPKHDLLKTAEIKEQSLKQEYAANQKLAANLPAYQEQMVEIKDRFANVLRQLPDKSEVPALLTDISQAGVEQGLKFERFKPASEEQKNFFVRLPIQIEASGGYHELAGFISAIANFQRIVTIGNLEIVRRNGAADSDETALVPLTFKADIYTYHFSEEEDPEAEGANAARLNN